MTETTQDTVHDTGRAGLRGENRLFAARIGIGLIQGLLLYALYRAADGKVWPSTQPELFGGLALAIGFAPVAALAGVGRLKWPVLAAWIGGVAVVLFLLGWHDVARRVLADYEEAPFLKFPVMGFAAAALFIAHHLFAPAVRVRRWVVDYHQYFDVAWKAGVQLALSLGFTGAFWILLQLGAALFDLIGLKFLTELVRSAWFALPVTCTAFAIAVQLTDVRDGLIRGVRTVALMLLSWLLLVITALTAGFLAALPFTGLDPLWATRSATAMLLGAAAALIILINTAYQDGQPDNLPPRVLRIATRVASVLVAPLVILAVWGLSLRIGQYGLTPDRIIAAACALVGAVYAGGYLFAAVRPGAWMKPLERTNIVAAILSVLMILALFSPLLDPTRLSVADQVARLERGKVKAADFDYSFLRFDSGKAGRAALDRLVASRDADTARLAREAKTSDARSAYSPDEKRELARQVKIEPIAGQTLPPDFMAQIQSQPDLALNCRADEACVLRTADLDGDGRQDVLLANRTVILAFTQGEDGRWYQRARYNAACGGAGSTDLKAALKTGVKTAPMLLPDLIVNGRRLQFWQETRCDPEAAR